jgi:hypothetical protein
MNESSLAGWVVQETIVVEPQVRAPGNPWNNPAAVAGAPTFKYYNVAISAPDKAIEATVSHVGKSRDAKAGAMSVVRKLSPAELTELKLKVGEVQPA